MIELKPCPFCGGKAMIITGNHSQQDFYRVVCEDNTCAMQATSYKTERQAIEAWNRRAIDGSSGT